MDQQKLRLMFTGGGSGGPTTPLLGLAETLKEHEEYSMEFLFLGTSRGPEHKMVEEFGMPYQAIPAIKAGEDYKTPDGEIIANSILSTAPPKPRSYAFCSDTRYTETVVPIIKGTDIDLGGTMRLGSYEAKLKKNSKINKIYGKNFIKERHRHRYEVNINYKEKFEKKGMYFSGLSPNGMLPEIIELKNHPWFIGVQFHPEFRSRPLAPHPLFSSFIKASKNHK